MAAVSGLDNIEDFYPLTPMQRGMIFHSLMTPDSQVYIEQFTCRLRGHLDLPSFEHAWNTVVSRHAILRTGFQGERLKEPVQVVHRSIRVPVEYYDWLGRFGGRWEEPLDHVLGDDRERPFDLASPPLLRLRLIRLEVNLHQFVWTYHHALLDGWSVPIVLQEVMLLYQAKLTTQELHLPRPYSFRDYVVWIRERAEGEAETFWRKYLDGFSFPTLLPFDTDVNVGTPGGSGAVQREIILAPRTAASLHAFGGRHRLTMSTILHGVWAILLSSYTGERDVMFGSTVSGRPPELPGAEFLVGLFINTVPLRIILKDDEPVEEYFSRVQGLHADAQQYAFSSLVQIHGWSDMPRHLPMFDHLMVFENYPVAQTPVAGDPLLEVEAMGSTELTNFPLTIVAGSQDEFVLRLVYDAERVGETTVLRILQQMEYVLTQIATNPGGRVGDISVCTPEETERATDTWNATDTPYPADRAVHHLFEDQVDRTPDVTAVVYGSERMTYRDLDQRANQLAHLLQKHGIEVEDRVGIAVAPSCAMIVAVLGALKGGGAYVPIDLTSPPERFSAILRDAGVSVLLIEDGHEDLVAGWDGTTLSWNLIRAELDAQSPERPRATVGPDNLAYVIFTSGSTGAPKGTLLHHRGICNLASVYKRALGLEVGTRVLQFFPLAFDGSAADIFSTLTAGATLVLLSRQLLMSPPELHAVLREQEVHVMLMTPSILAILPSEGLPRLRLVLAAGEACPKNVAERWKIGRRFVNAYGPTETTVAASLWEVDQTLPETSSVPLGRPLPNVQLYVLDSSLRPVPVGGRGEVYIGGVGLARGYLGLPALTADRFIPNPYGKPGSRLYRTGDRGRYLEDGRVEYLGRIDGQIKLRGYRIELDEIDAVVKEHPAVRESVSVLTEGRVEEMRIMTYIVGRNEAPVTEAEVTTFVRRKLPPYMVPSSIVIVDEIPRTRSGKIDRNTLRNSGLIQRAVGASLVHPRDQWEAGLVEIWEELLQKHPIGVTENFFDLGGHSFLAVRLAAIAHERFGKELPLLAIVQNPTIESLAAVLREEKHAETESVVVELRQGTLNPPLFCVHPTGGSVHWYADLARSLAGGRAVYGLQAFGADGSEVPDTSIEVMASRYTSAIVATAVEGPYHILGWSLGVVVAFEIARQLRRMGRRVATLMVLDQGPAPPDRSEPVDDVELLIRIFSPYFPLDAEYLRSLDPDEQLAIVLRKAKRAGLVPHLLRLQTFRQYISMNKIETRAWRMYTGEPYPGAITLFRSEESAAEPDILSDLGWGRLAVAGVDVIDVGGTHISMLQKPHVQALAREMDRIMVHSEIQGV